MIEQLQVSEWTTQPADLNGNLTGPAQVRLVCSYFPPHVQFSKDVLTSEYFSELDKASYPSVVEQDGRVFEVSQVAQLRLHNGGAIYLLNDTLEGKLWKLILGLDEG